MSINFDSLPTENSNKLPTPGLYKGVITGAEMRTPKDTSKADYLNVSFDLFDMKGNACGKLWDILTEPTSDFIGYKIMRFVRACGIPTQGSMELSDLAKIITGKEMYLDVKIDEGNGNFGSKPVVNLFDHEAYYHLNELEQIRLVFSLETSDEAVDDFLNVEAGADSTQPFSETSSASEGAPVQEVTEAPSNY